MRPTTPTARPAASPSSPTTAMRALALDPADLGATEPRETIEPFGEVVVHHLDLEERWQAERGLRRIDIDAVAGRRRRARDRRGHRPHVWGALTSPDRRAAWEGAIVMVDVPGAPRGVGSTARCVTGRLATLEEIVDWMPYEHVGYRLAVPGIGPVEASYDLDAVEAGTEVRLSLGGRRRRAGGPCSPDGRGHGSPAGPRTPGRGARHDGRTGRSRAAARDPWSAIRLDSRVTGGVLRGQHAHRRARRNGRRVHGHGPLLRARRVAALGARGENGYREYSAADAEHLRLFLDLRHLDIPLAVAADLARSCHTGHCDAMATALPSVIEAQRATIADRVSGLQALDARLATSRAPRPAAADGRRRLLRGGRCGRPASAAAVPPRTASAAWLTRRALAERAAAVALVAAGLGFGLARRRSSSSTSAGRASCP